MGELSTSDKVALGMAAAGLTYICPPAGALLFTAILGGCKSGDVQNTHDGGGGGSDARGADSGGIEDRPDHYSPPRDSSLDSSLDLGADLRADSGTSFRGINPSAWNFPGPIADIDAADGGLFVYGGEPPKVWFCAVDGIGPAECNVIADLPAGISTAINYLSMPGGLGVANTSSANGNPFDIVVIDESAADPASAVLMHDHRGEVTIPGTGWHYSPTYPAGLAVYHVSGPTARDRIFTATRNYLPSESRFISGTILCHANEGDPYGPLEQVGFPHGTNTSALATTRINLGEGDRDVLIALNAGGGVEDATISVMDPGHFEIALLKTIQLGDGVVAAPLSEFALNASGRVAYVGVQEPGAAIYAVDLETEDIEEMSLCCGISDGEITDISADGDNLYTSGAGTSGEGLIVFTDAASGALRGHISLPDLPETVDTLGGYIYIGAGDALMSIDPSEVELTP